MVQARQRTSLTEEGRCLVSVSMRVMRAGDGYKYLLRTVAAADGERPLSTPLTRYCAEAGTPPGRWLGSGLAALAGGRINAGSRVSKRSSSCCGEWRDPGTAAPLRRAYPEYAASEASLDSAEAAMVGLRPNGRLILSGLDFTQPFEISSEAMPFHMMRQQVIGSTHGGQHYLSQVLDLAGKGKVKPITETFTLDQATEAYDRLASGTMRYRGVFTPHKS